MNGGGGGTRERDVTPPGVQWLQRSSSGNHGAFLFHKTLARAFGKQHVASQRRRSRASPQGTWRQRARIVTNSGSHTPQHGTGTVDFKAFRRRKEAKKGVNPEVHPPPQHLGGHAGTSRPLLLCSNFSFQPRQLLAPQPGSGLPSPLPPPGGEGLAAALTSHAPWSLLGQVRLGWSRLGVQNRRETQQAAGWLASLKEPERDDAAAATYSARAHTCCLRPSAR